MVPTVDKRKGKAVTSLELPLLVEEAASILSIEALMADLTLFKEPLLKDPKEEVISGLVSVYGKEVMKKVQDLLRDCTPFQMAALEILCLYFLFSIMSLFLLLTTTVSNKHFRHLHGEVFRCLATLAQLPVSHEGGGLGYAHESPG